MLDRMRAALVAALTLCLCACTSLEVAVGDSVEDELREYYQAEADSPLAKGEGDPPESVDCTKTEIPAWDGRADAAHTCVLAFQSGKRVTMCVISRGAHKLAWTVPQPCETLPRQS